MKDIKVEKQLESGILDETDQKIAQRLYDYATEKGGLLRNTNEGRIFRVQVTDYKRTSQSMEVYIGGNSGVETRLRRGRRSWQDDGSRAITAQFGDGSMMAGEEFHPDLEQRREALRLAAYKFLPDQP